MAEEVTVGGHEYRSKGGEVHRRPADREGLRPWDAAWLVLTSEQVPTAVREHFVQAQDKAAVL